MAQETSSPRTTDSSPDQGSGERESTTNPTQTGTSARRVPLARLLSVVVLSPAQASLVAVQVLDATHVAGTTNGAHPPDAYLWTVALTPSGDVELARAPAGEGNHVTEILDQLSRNARQLPAHPRSEQLVLLRRLEDTAADGQLEPGARAHELAAALAEVLGPGARQRLSGQLAALVNAFAHIAPSVAAPAAALAAPGGSRPRPHRAEPARSRPGRPQRRGQPLGHRHARNHRMVLVVLLVAVALAASGYVVLRSTDTGGGGALGRDNAPAAPTTNAPSGSSGEPAQPGSRPRPDVAALAGREAGPITGVELQKAGSCTPGTPCPVTVTVRFRSASTTQPVSWKVGTARLCGSGITWSPPITVSAQPGWTTVYASSSVPVPEGRSVALVALTTAPARAQSPPVPVTGSSLRC